MPYPSAERPIQYEPTGLFGPGLIVKSFFGSYTFKFVVGIIPVVRIGIY